MNIGFYENKDVNFEQACQMSDKDFTHEELISMLRTGNIPQKQIAALKFDYVKSPEDADILISNLTGCDGKIREATALKINQLLNDNYIDFFAQYPDIFANSTIDINGNICRLTVDSVNILKRNSQFAGKYLSKIIEFINDTYKELDKFIYRDKKYVINKQLFKLYWCLEALKIFAENMDIQELHLIVNRAAEEKEYTIREKVAQIIRPLNAPEFNELKNRLKNDDNYYVRAVFNQ